MEPHRRFVKSGTFTSVVKGVQTTLHLFLFNDILFICTIEENHKKYLFSSIVPMDQCSVGGIADTNESM